MADLTHPSPHFNKRNGKSPRVLVLHADAGTSDKGTLEWLANPESKVSYHALIGRNGAIYKCVDMRSRAWHAGKSEWNGVSDVNGISIGLAFCNRHDGKEALTPAQLATGLAYVTTLARDYPTLEAVVTHMDIAPGRKTDPTNTPGFSLEHFADAFAQGKAQ